MPEVQCRPQPAADQCNGRGSLNSCPPLARRCRAALHRWTPATGQRACAARSPCTTSALPSRIAFQMTLKQMRWCCSSTAVIASCSAAWTS